MVNQKDRQAGQPVAPDQKEDANFPSHYYHDDEISLIDLGKVLYKRFWVMFLVAAITVAISLVVALNLPRHYNFQTTLDIGSVINDEGRLSSIEQPQDLLARVNASYSPAVRLEYLNRLAEEHELSVEQVANQLGVPRLSARIPENSRSLQLTSQVSREAEASTMAEEMHLMLVERIVNDHDRRFSVQKQNLDQERQTLSRELRRLEEGSRLDARLVSIRLRETEARTELRRLEDPALQQAAELRLNSRILAAERDLASTKSSEEALRETLERQDDKRELLTEQLSEAREDLRSLRQTRQEFLSSNNGDANQRALMMEGQITSAQDIVRSLESALLWELPEETSRIRRELVEIQNKTAEQEAKLEQAKQELEEFQVNQSIEIEQVSSRIAGIETEIQNTREEHESRIEEQRSKLAQIENQLDRIQPTQIAIAPHRGTDLQGTSGKLVLALGIVLGGILGIMAAFFTEFAMRVRQSIKEENN